MTTLPNNYRERVYAGWLGKCIGVRLGAPVENWTAKEIADNLGAVNDFLPLPPGTIFKPDDDTAAPLVLIRALEDCGSAVTAEQIGETMLNYLADQRGTIWWGGYGVSTEHTAYINLMNGIAAPRSGSIAQNGKMIAEQIGGQIFSDIWGLVAPNDPARAAELAARASSVANDGEGIFGGRFIAALVSCAFSEANPVRLIERALEQIPRDSEYARVVNAMLDFHRAEPDDWRAGYRFLAQNFGYAKYPGVVPIISNAGVVVLALLYSEGDGSTWLTTRFSRAIQIATNAGWDTDCNAGNVGAVMGVAVGLDGIEQHWRAAMNDVLVGASVIGARNLMTIPACADLFARLGEKIAHIESPARPRYHFDYPGTTQGFGAHAQLGEIFLRPARDRALQIYLRGLKKKGEARAFVRTYYRANELSANYYSASFSPLIYLGQTIAARMFIPADAPEGLIASLFVWDDNARVTHQEPGAMLNPGQWQTLAFTLPRLDNALLSQVGIAFRNIGEAWTGNVLLESLDWNGAPNFACDFSRERNEFGAISGWTFLRGFWRMEDGAFHGSGAGISEAYTGDITWRDYTLAVDLVPVIGNAHYVLARVQGARRSYAFGLAPENRVALYKNNRAVADAAFAWELGRKYRIEIAARGAELIAKIDDREMLRWTDATNPYLSGQIGVANIAGHTRIERVAIQ
ncbi:MAG: ADP-ribosylglycohydrolase family protein [Chloroflexi bacterium]|nr:ADP-ribosylglycohydrolase family protein [Chloroflexota bacterium]